MPGHLSVSQQSLNSSADCRLQQVGGRTRAAGVGLYEIRAPGPPGGSRLQTSPRGTKRRSPGLPGAHGLLAAGLKSLSWPLRAYRMRHMSAVGRPGRMRRAAVRLTPSHAPTEVGRSVAVSLPRMARDMSSRHALARLTPTEHTKRIRMSWL